MSADSTPGSSSTSRIDGARHPSSDAAAASGVSGISGDAASSPFVADVVIIGLGSMIHTLSLCNIGVRGSFHIGGNANAFVFIAAWIHRRPFEHRSPPGQRREERNRSFSEAMTTSLSHAASFP
ncbi:hypothetical protein [Burkholderia stabilis]|uniref:hypothetical protein n=1 Tax=Burkholderia stabilis TaxID=95485 RepID=UPI001F4A185E|nr:hypothetical protein [Burkholderia stabilis]